MKTKQQVVECIYTVLATKMAHPYLSAFHTDARLREDLALDSSAVLELLVSLELEWGLALPEDALMNEDLDTVRGVAKRLFDAQPSSSPDKILDYEEDIKLHCFVSCLSEVLKRHEGIDHRALYFGVWDAEIVVSDRSTISYHSATISHHHFIEWYRRLYGIAVTAWYDAARDQAENTGALVALVEGRTPDQHIMVMLDMYRLPERVNEFNKDPFPHYLMLGPTPNPAEWMMYDPDYRWEGIAKKDRVLHAFESPAVAGGYLFSDEHVHAPEPRQIAAYYDACMRLHDNPMTDAIRRVLTAHLEGRDALALSGLGAAFDEVPILAIRKYAYEHGLAFFFRELGLGEDEFETWCEVIATLVKTYRLVQFHAIKLAATQDHAIAERIFGLLNEQDERERKIKARMHELYRLWCDATLSPNETNVVAGVAS